MAMRARRQWREVTAVVAAMLVMGLLPGASALDDGHHTTCRYADGVVRLRLASQHQVRLYVVDRRITFHDLRDSSRGGPCGRARVGNTDRILIRESAPGTARLQFDEQLGRLAPGRTREASGVSEIEVKLGTLKDLWVMTRARAQDITVGAHGVNINGDRDVDLIGDNLRVISVYSADGDDRITASGGRGTGEAWNRGSLIVYAGDGDDTVIGSRRGDVLDGGLGFDQIEGRAGNDLIDGGQEGDRLYGGSGRDFVTGDSWADEIYGGPGDDTLDAADSTADAVDGGDGEDKAFIDDADDVSAVESPVYGAP